jgi:hypothetical protein
VQRTVDVYLARPAGSRVAGAETDGSAATARALGGSVAARWEIEAAGQMVIRSMVIDRSLETPRPGLDAPPR